MMFKSSTPVAEPAPVSSDLPEDKSDLVPVSHVSLELDAPVGGWAAYLSGRGITVIQDDIGRASIARADAKMLLDEQRENERRQREAAEARDRAAVQADKAWRSQLSRGVSWLDMPPGVAPAAAMLAVDEDSRVSVREQLLQQELAHLSNGG
jgi:hypothetical protein